MRPDSVSPPPRTGGWRGREGGRAVGTASMEGLTHFKGSFLSQALQAGPLCPTPASDHPPTPERSAARWSPPSPAGPPCLSFLPLPPAACPTEGSDRTRHCKHLPIVPPPPSLRGRVPARVTPRPLRRIFPPPRSPPAGPEKREGMGAGGCAWHLRGGPPRCYEPASGIPRSGRQLWDAAKVTRAGCGQPRGPGGLRKSTCSGNVAARLPT